MGFQFPLLCFFYRIGDDFDIVLTLSRLIRLMGNTKRGFKHLHGDMDREQEGILDKRKAWQKTIQFSQRTGSIFFEWWVVFISVYQCGGPLHRNGLRIWSLTILPFVQRGHVLRSIPAISSKSSFQVVDSSFLVSIESLPRSSRHKAMLFLRLLFASSP